MKAIVTLTLGLIFVSNTFAQTSRRSDTNREKEKTESSEKRTPSENTNKTTEVSSTNRRGTQAQPSEKKTEVRTPVTQDRSSAPNRPNPSEQNRNSRPTNEVTSRPPTSRPATSSPKQYDNNRRDDIRRDDNQREPSGNNQVIVQDHSRRTVEPRHRVVVHNSYKPVPVEVRREKYPYRAPVRTEVIWTVDLSRRFEVYYPDYRPYRYHVGSRLATVSAYDAFDFVGEIARVYGRVSETYYSFETDELTLYIGDYYPYQDFSVIIPGREARDFNPRPEKFFERENIEVTGLISRFEGKPEMVIKRSSQITVY
jgi:hypothetical protein